MGKMVEKREEEPVPCAALQVLTLRVSQLEEWQVRQNGHLGTIEKHLAELKDQLEANRLERQQQISKVEVALARQSSGLWKAALLLVVPIAASLLYIVLNHAIQ